MKKSDNKTVSLKFHSSEITQLQSCSFDVYVYSFVLF